MTEQTDPIAQGGRYCKQCNYDLRASVERCPECGRAFDPMNPKTYRRKPVSAAWQWVHRIAVFVLLLVTLPPAGLLGWLWLGWRADDKTSRWLTTSSQGVVEKRQDVYPRLSARMPGMFKFLTVRVTNVRMGQSTTDADLAHLAGMTQMRHLSLISTKITDAGLAHLSGMTQMRGLDLIGTQITDAGLAHLRNMTQMEQLTLMDGPRVGDAGLAHLAGMTQMRLMWLNSPLVTDAGVAHLAGMAQIKTLFLDKGQITDAGLVHMRGMTQMTNLSLSGTQVTDAGLPNLTGMKRLEDLHVRNTRVTSAGADKFRAALPGVMVWRP
jgi:hypothetical protein